MTEADRWSGPNGKYPLELKLDGGTSCSFLPFRRVVAVGRPLLNLRKSSQGVSH